VGEGSRPMIQAPDDLDTKTEAIIAEIERKKVEKILKEIEEID
jgi:hypothetical protein